MKNWIRSVGCEIEGGILEAGDYDSLYREGGRLVRDFTIGGDVSVWVSECEYESVELKFWFYYPKEYENAKKFIKFVFERLKQNHTCGNHIHLKFKGDVWTLISFPKFFRKFKEEYVKFSESKGKRKDIYLSRLKERWCRYRYSELTVVNQLRRSYRLADRYTMINLNSFPKYKTIEFRILPFVLGAEEYLENLEWLINTVNKLISSLLERSVLITKKSWVRIHSEEYILVDDIELIDKDKFLDNDYTITIYK